MIKARAHDLIILGLSDENIERLKKGQPISVNLDEIGVPFGCFIFHGTTEDAMIEKLSTMIGHTTVIRNGNNGGG